LIRGADGALYFVPEKILQGFRLDAKKRLNNQKVRRPGIVEEEIPEGDILPFLWDDLAFLENGGEFFFLCE